MINKNIRAMLLFIALCVLFVGIVNAADVDSGDSAGTLLSGNTQPDTPVGEVQDNVMDNGKAIRKDVKTNIVKTATDKQKTKIDIDYVPDVSVGDVISIRGTFTDANDTPIKGTSLQFAVDDDSSSARTDNSGVFSMIYLADVPGNKTVTVSYGGNSKYAATSAERTFTVSGKYSTRIVLDGIKNVKLGDKVTVSGHLYYNQSTPLKQASMTINLNGQKKNARTDKNGYFSYTTRANKTGISTVTVTYQGSDKYKDSFAVKVFTVRPAIVATDISLNDIPSTTLGSTVKVTGNLTYDKTRPLKKATVTVNVNGEKKTVTTDSKGHFSYTLKAAKTGINTVTATYRGNDKYRASVAVEVFTVKADSPQKTYISLDDIPKTALGKTVTISGRYTYGQSKPLRQTSMIVNVNGGKAYTKTDKNGYFSYTCMANKTGINKVTVSYPGNDKFKGASATKRFTVESSAPQETYISLNSIPGRDLGDTVTVSGHYYYGLNQPLRQTSMLVNVNGHKAYAKTDNNGYFSYEYTTTRSGVNTVSVSYPGTDRFKGATAMKVFTVTGRQATRIQLNDIPETSLGNTVTVSGHYYYALTQPLRLTSVLVNLNGQKAYAKTDDDGYFAQSFKATKAGINTVNVSYAGTEKFKGTSTVKTFNVKSSGPQETYITINDIPIKSVGDSVTISGRYTYGNSQPLRQTSMLVDVNGQKAYAKTDDRGYYSYTIKADKMGTNNVTVSYAGTANFKAATASKTFTVTNNTRMETLYFNGKNYVSKVVDDVSLAISYSSDKASQYGQGVIAEIDSRGVDTPTLNSLVKAKYYFKNSAGDVITRVVDATDSSFVKTSLIDGYVPYKVDAFITKLTG